MVKGTYRDTEIKKLGALVEQIPKLEQDKAEWEKSVKTAEQNLEEAEAPFQVNISSLEEQIEKLREKKEMELKEMGDRTLSEGAVVRASHDRFRKAARALQTAIKAQPERDYLEFIRRVAELESQGYYIYSLNMGLNDGDKLHVGQKAHDSWHGSTVVEFIQTTQGRAFLLKKLNGKKGRRIDEEGIPWRVELELRKQLLGGYNSAGWSREMTCPKGHKDMLKGESYCPFCAATIGYKCREKGCGHVQENPEACKCRTEGVEIRPERYGAERRQTEPLYPDTPRIGSLDSLDSLTISWSYDREKKEGSYKERPLPSRSSREASA